MVSSREVGGAGGGSVLVTYSIFVVKEVVVSALDGDRSVFRMVAEAVASSGTVVIVSPSSVV